MVFWPKFVSFFLLLLFIIFILLLLLIYLYYNIIDNYAIFIMRLFDSETNIWSETFLESFILEKAYLL